METGASVNQAGVLLWPGATEQCAAARSTGKLGIDLAGSALLLVVCAPIILMAALLMKLSSPGPVFFRQLRIGYQGRPFWMWKLRTMVDGAERQERALAARLGHRTFFKLADDPRVTRAGRLLRKYSVDELPQLWNVLRGDMSLVGPRPILVSDFERMPRAAQWERFGVRPGLTGLWQVSGRSRCTDAERMALDLQYVQEWDLRLDLRILLCTIPAVCRADGAF